MIREIFSEVQGSRSSRKNAILLRQHIIKSKDYSDFYSCLNRVLVCKKADANADRTIRFVAQFISLLESEDQEHSEVFTTFLGDFLEHLLRGIESREKNVRYRICQLLAYLMASGLSELDEEQFEQLERALIKRLRDKESNVRVQAVVALSRFQTEEDDKITEVMLHVLGHDPSADVRRAALHNISQSSLTLPFLLERARDTDPAIRRQVYSTILPAINGFKPLSISKRNKLLKWGLRDRDESVRKAAERMFAIDWLNLANGSILELLQRLDIVNSEIGSDAMTAFLKMRPEFLDQARLDDEFWDLNPESAFLVRCMRNHCTENQVDSLDDKLPELSALCDMIVKFMALAATQEEAEKADTEFVIDNILKLAQQSDLADEIGRRRLTSIATEILRSNLAENLLVDAVEVLCTVSLNENETTALIKESIVDLYDVLEADESFHSAKSEIAEEEAPVKYIFTTLRALAIIGSLLQNISGTIITNPSLKAILNDFIVPAIRSHEGPIRERGIDCLGQICLLDQSLAKDNLELFLHCFAKGHEDLKIQALKIVTDIMMAHPILLKEGDEAEAAKELGGESSPEDDLVRIYLKAFQLDDMPEVTAMATISVSKLLLFNIIAPESPNARGLLKEMATLYYSPLHVDNQTLRQNLAYFFPVYAFSSAAHQEAMTSLVVPVLKRISRIYDSLDVDEKNDIVPLQSIANQLIDWSDAQKLVNTSEDTYTEALGTNILRRINVAEKEEARVLANALSKLAITDEVADDLDAAIESCKDAIAKRALIKAKTKVNLRIRETPESEDTRADETIASII